MEFLTLRQSHWEYNIYSAGVSVIGINSLRSTSSSKCFFLGETLQSIMSKCAWATSSPFYKYYLTPVSTHSVWWAKERKSMDHGWTKYRYKFKDIYVMQKNKCIKEIVPSTRSTLSSCCHGRCSTSSTTSFAKRNLMLKTIPELDYL